MHELIPGLIHWTARHPSIGADVSSYLLVEERVLLDPLLPPDGGVEAIRAHGAEPQAIVLTNRHHSRHSEALVEAFGCRVLCRREGLHEFADRDLEVEGFEPGDDLPGGLIAHEVGVICPDETAIEVPGARALALADGAMHYGPELSFVSDEHLGDDPEAIKAGLRGAYARLADVVEFDHLLVAHGAPIVGSGREALRRFAAGD